jgi:hypothetical protein
MSDLSSLLMLLVLVSTAAVWLRLTKARELAAQQAQQQCRQHGLQLLDETVSLRGLRLRKVHGLRRLERHYGFEVSLAGDDRQPGRLSMIGDSLSGISLPTAAPQLQTAALQTAATETAVPVTTQPGTSGNVISLQAHRRGRNRLL